jgi:hypothetical protein
MRAMRRTYPRSPPGRRLFLIFPLALRCPRDLRHSEGAGDRQFLGGSQRACADAVQQIGLGRFQRDEPAEHMQQVEQIGGVFGQGGRRSALNRAVNAGCAMMAAR